MNRTDHDTEEAVRRFLTLIRERYDVVGAILYGSRARGTFDKDSDVDLVVLLAGELEWINDLKVMSGIAFDVMLETAQRIIQILNCCTISAGRESCYEREYFYA